MKKNKIRKLITTTGELMVSPVVEINIDPNYVYVEFIFGDNINSWETAEITDSPICYEYQLDDDGLYYYNRWKIITSDFIGDMSNYSGIYYNTNDNNIYIGSIILSEETFNSIVQGCNRDVNTTKYNIHEWILEPVFSIARINKCLEDKQRKFIFNTISDCKLESCEENKTDKFKRDFLFNSVFVLKCLIKQQRFYEALQILNYINNCNWICNKNKSNKCSCEK